jgi:FKBP-type peptidyl-prolyl cis-trans isomerase
MRKLFFPCIAALLMLTGASTALVGCKDSTADAIQATLDHQNKIKVVDDSLIRDHLSRHNYTNFTRTDAGIYLVPLTSNPQGAQASTGKQVAVKYIGRFVNKDREDIIFDSSFSGKTLCDCISFTVGSTSLIPGWGQGLPLMRQGERHLLFIPSYLAYNTTGSGSIGADTPLVFDMEVISVSK